MDPLGESSSVQRRKALAMGLREQLETGSFSQQEVANLSGVSQSVISKLLREKVDATPKTVRKLAEAFGLTPQGFLQGVRVGSGRTLLAAPGARKAADTHEPSLGNKYHRMTASTHGSLPPAAPKRPPQRTMQRPVGSADPEAKRLVSLRDAFNGCFANDIADLAWRITLKKHLHQCHDDVEFRDHFDGAIVYWAKRIKWQRRIDRYSREWVQRNNKRIMPLDPDAVASVVATMTLKYLGSPDDKDTPFDLENMEKVKATVATTIGRRHVATLIEELTKEREQLPTVPLDESRDYRSSHSTPIDEMCGAQWIQGFEDALRGLPVELRQILNAKRSGDSLRKIAKDRGGKVSHETIRARLFEAHGLMRDSLRERDLM